MSKAESLSAMEEVEAPPTGKQGQVVGRLEEALRREIFRELLEAERRARAEADELYETDPTLASEWRANIEPNAGEFQKRMIEYQGAVRERYEITEEEQGWIAQEGIQEQWPPLYQGT